jgi:hypothetical protein
MTDPHNAPHRHVHRIGMLRREVLQVGYSGLFGLGLGHILEQRQARASPSATSTGTPKSILLIFLTGAASHHDTFDMKPLAPAEVRGEFKPIETSVPGIQICEHLPKLASLAHEYAIVRSLSHKDNNHLMSTHHVLTGMVQPNAFFDKVASRDDWPNYASGLAYVRPRQDGIPSGVQLPTFLLDGPLTWPGQHAGFLGPKFDPWMITGDPSHPDFRLESLTLTQGLSVERLANRSALLEQLNRQQQSLLRSAEVSRLTNQQSLAMSMLTASRFTKAFQLNDEAEPLRDKYGRNTTGQSLLLARRLIEVGVPIVQANIGRVQNWDHHQAIFTTLKERCLPPLDQAVAALLGDMKERGLLEETLVVMVGEFGRTPKINKDAGRDHWGPCFFGLFAGGGVQGGQVIGKSDEQGAYPVTQPYSPDDLGATIYHLLGIPADAEVRDRQNRPARLNQGQIIQPLFTGRSV